MWFFHDDCKIGLNIRFGPAPVPKGNKEVTLAIWLIPMVPSTLSVFALTKLIFTSPSKEISLMFTAPNNECDRVLPELVACCSAEISDLNDVPCGRLLVAESTVESYFASSFYTVRLPMAQVEDTCFERPFVLREFVAILDSARLPASIQSFAAVSRAGFFWLFPSCAANCCRNCLGINWHCA